MNLIIKIWNDPVLSKVIAGIIIIMISPLSSKIFTDDWFSFYKIIPIEIWISLLFLLLILIIYILFRRSKGKNETISPFTFIPLRGWEDIAQKEQYGVNWVIRKPRGDVFDLYYGNQTKPEDLNIKTPPFCPKCETELKEKKTFLGRFKWYCVKCDFSKKSKISFYIVCDDVRKIVQSEFRKYLKNNN